MIKLVSYQECGDDSTCKINVTKVLNRTKGKNHIITSIESEKAFDTIQCAFTIKAWKKPGIEGPYFDLIKIACDKPISEIIL
jgi:hypothetical protein